MCSVLPIKGNLVTNVRNYLQCSYNLGYDLDLYFSKNQQITMFERLLSCDASFKQEWESGTYSIPENPAHTMYLSKYIKRQSLTKKLSRKIGNYVYNKKLTRGGKNLLQAYMIKHSQDKTNMEDMFCGIFKQISDRKKSYISKKVPSELATEIIENVSGGTKRKRTRKNTKRHTLKRGIFI